MQIIIWLVWLLAWIIIWSIFVYFYLKSWKIKEINEANIKREEILNEANIKREEAEKESWEMINKSRTESQELLKKAEKESWEMINKSRTESQDLIKKAEKLEERLLEKEEKLESKLDEISKKYENILQKEDSLKQKKEEIQKKEDSINSKLSEIARLTENEAKEMFLNQIKTKYESDWLIQIEKYKKSIEERKNDISREIILKSIQQYAWDVTNEVTTTLIPLPNDDLKWKLIWKEWRNIVAFERATWVALIIDDTPDTVFISAFDLFKRYIAKKSLEKLLEDGRIQPARIEEIVEITNSEANILLKDIWIKTLDELNISWIPEDIIPIIGKMRFRTSYGQNILKHSTEVAYIAESIARDLNLDPVLAKKWWLLHDIWKALDHDIEWTHPEIWAKLWRKYGLDERIIDMIENHHWEPTSISVYAAVVQMADAISSVRPWARRESIEQYVKRVKEMEALVASFTWVTKAYAISAWREIRVFVDANCVSDFEAQETARNIALEIEQKLNYPWEVKINLIRELRVIQYAK